MKLSRNKLTKSVSLGILGAKKGETERERWGTVTLACKISPYYTCITGKKAEKKRAIVCSSIHIPESEPLTNKGISWMSAFYIYITTYKAPSSSFLFMSRQITLRYKCPILFIMSEWGTERASQSLCFHFTTNPSSFTPPTLNWKEPSMHYIR